MSASDNSNDVACDRTGEAQAIVDTVERLSGESVRGLTTEDRYVILPRGKRIESLKEIIDKFRAKPERRRGTVVLNTEDSFQEFVHRYKNQDLTAIFAKRDFKMPSLLAVFDYHEQDTSDVTRAEWGQFRARYPFPLSKEWKVWFENNHKVMTTTDFAAFVEDNIADLAAIGGDADSDAKMNELADLVKGTFASPSQLMDMSRSLQVNVSSALKQAQSLSSGEIAITYQEVHNDGAGKPIKIPNLFIVGIPIFDGGVRYRIAARLRYRVQGPAISWSYSLVKPEASFDDAFDETVATVKENTNLDVFYGEPETGDTSAK